MRITIVYGQQHKGNTYKLTQLLVSELKEAAKEQETCGIQEFYVNDMSYCVGCVQCIMESEERCPYKEELRPARTAIEEADIVMLVSPNYCMNMSGQLKTFCDHMAYRWMSHRPLNMRNKTGVAISTTAGMGAGKVTKLIKEQMQWWSVGRVFRLPQVIWDMKWEDTTSKQMKKLQVKVHKAAVKIYKNRLHPRVELKLKFLFFMMKNMHKEGMCPPLESEYWKAQHLI